MESPEILDFYHLKSPNPQSWVADTVVPAASISQHKQPSTLDDPSSPSLLRKGDGLQLLLKLVNEDLNRDPNPTDPLNPAISIKTLVKDQDDLLKFSTNSKQFNSKNFLRVLHKDDSFEQLTASLNILDQSISEKNRELQALIHSNHLKFLRSKFSIDDVLRQFGTYQEKEFQLTGLSKSITDTNKDSTIAIKPVVSNKQKEMKLRQSLEFVEKHKLFFNLSRQLNEYIASNDYDNFIHDYKHAKQEMEKMNHKVINRIWEDIENLVDSYKNSLWNSLNEQDQSLNDDQFTKVIRKLLELDSIDNPILQWSEFQFNTVSKNIEQCFKLGFEKLGNYQVNIMTNYRDVSYDQFKNTLVLLSTNASGNATLVTGLIDNYNVIEMWLTLNKLLQEANEIVTRFKSTYKTLEKYITGEIRIHSKYIDNSVSQNFLNLQDFELEKIVKDYHHLILNKIITRLFKIFNYAQGSSLQDPTTQQQNGCFLPPNSNSLSSLKYLTTISKSVNEILTNLGQLSKLNDTKTIERLRECSQVINEKITSVVCAAYINDCSQFYKLENWVLASKEDNNSNGTFIPSLIQAFQNYIVNGLETLLFHNLPSSEDSVTIVRYPDRKLLTGVEVQFLRSFDVLLESIIKKIIEDNNIAQSETQQAAKIEIGTEEAVLNNSKNLRNFHKLLTLLNIQALSSNVFPLTIATYDKAFGAKLQDQNLEIYQLLKKMESTIFDSYLKDQHKVLSKIIHIGFQTLTSAQNQPTHTTLKVSPFIYELLNSLNAVYIKTHQVSSSLIKPIFINLLDYISSTLLKQYRSIPTPAPSPSPSQSSSLCIQQCVLDLQFLHGITANLTKGNKTIDGNLQLIYKVLFDRGDDYDAMLKVVKREIMEFFEDEMEASVIAYEVFNGI